MKLLSGEVPHDAFEQHPVRFLDWIGVWVGANQRRGGETIEHGGAMNTVVKKVCRAGGMVCFTALRFNEFRTLFIQKHS